MQREKRSLTLWCKSFNSTWLGNPTQVTIALLNRIRTAWEKGSSFIARDLEKPPSFSLLRIPTGGSPFSFLGLRPNIYNPSSEEPISGRKAQGRETRHCKAFFSLQPSTRRGGSSRPAQAPRRNGGTRPCGPPRSSPQQRPVEQRCRANRRSLLPRASLPAEGPQPRARLRRLRRREIRTSLPLRALPSGPSEPGPAPPATAASTSVAADKRPAEAGQGASSSRMSGEGPALSESPDRRRPARSSAPRQPRAPPPPPPPRRRHPRLPAPSAALHKSVRGPQCTATGRRAARPPLRPRLWPRCGGSAPARLPALLTRVPEFESRFPARPSLPLQATLPPLTATRPKGGLPHLGGSGLG